METKPEYKVGDWVWFYFEKHAYKGEIKVTSNPRNSHVVKSGSTFLEIRKKDIIAPCVGDDIPPKKRTLAEWIMGAIMNTKF